MCGARRAAALRLPPVASVEPRLMRPSRHPATTSPGLCASCSHLISWETCLALVKVLRFLTAESLFRTVTAEKSSLRAFQRYLAHPSTRRQSGDLAAGARARAQSWEPVGSSNARPHAVCQNVTKGGTVGGCMVMPWVCECIERRIWVRLV